MHTITVDHLITCVGKTKEELIALLPIFNIKMGNVIIGNQMSESDSKYEISNGCYKAIVYNMTSKGVSKNRNYLLSKANSEYVIFWDDDTSYIEHFEEKVHETIMQNAKFDVIRFNFQSTNNLRPSKIINKTKQISFRTLKKYGAGCMYIKRKKLLDDRILFDENLGPGTLINHGEDTIFNYNLCKKNKILQIGLTPLIISQASSTWQGCNRNIELECYSKGYIFWRIMHNLSFLFIYYYYLKHKKDFSTNYWQNVKWTKKGISDAKKYYR